MASSPISAKYSQSIPAAAIGALMDSASRVNMPPSTPSIITTNRTMYAATAALERALFFFAS